MPDLSQQYPADKGLTWHRSRNYSYVLPKDWQQFFCSEERAGHIHGPDPHNPATVFAVTLSALQTVVNADDLEILTEDLSESAEKLPACKIEARNQKIAGKQLQPKAKCTVEEYGNTRKCWQHILYHGTRQDGSFTPGETPSLHRAQNFVTAVTR